MSIVPGLRKTASRSCNFYIILFVTENLFFSLMSFFLKLLTSWSTLVHWFFQANCTFNSRVLKCIRWNRMQRFVKGHLFQLVILSLQLPPSNRFIRGAIFPLSTLWQPKLSSFRWQMDAWIRRKNFSDVVSWSGWRSHALSPGLSICLLAKPHSFCLSTPLPFRCIIYSEAKMSFQRAEPMLL